MKKSANIIPLLIVGALTPFTAKAGNGANLLI